MTTEVIYAKRGAISLKTFADTSKARVEERGGTFSLSLSDEWGKYYSSGFIETDDEINEFSSDGNKISANNIAYIRSIVAMGATSTSREREGYAVH